MFSRAVRWPVLRRRCDGVRPRRVERQGVARVHLGEVGAHVIEVERAAPLRRGAADLALSSMKASGWPPHGVAGRDGEAADDAADRGLDDVLHLHRLHDQDRLPAPHRVALGELRG